MSLVDTVSGIIRVHLDFVASRSGGPRGRDHYGFPYSASFDNTESAGDGTAYRIRVLFDEVITVIASDSTLSLADSADPMGGLGSNVPSGDPEGGNLKAIGFHNQSPSDGNGQTAYICLAIVTGKQNP